MTHIHVVLSLVDFESKGLARSVVNLRLASCVVQGQLNVASVFGADENQQLHGSSVLADMKELLRLLTICIHFSKKTFPQFLEVTGFTRDQVLLEEGRAGVRSIFLMVGKHQLFGTLCLMMSLIYLFHISFPETAVYAATETSIYGVSGPSVAVYIASDSRNSQYKGHSDGGYGFCGAFPSHYSR